MSPATAGNADLLPLPVPSTFNRMGMGWNFTAPVTPSSSTPMS
jgi:hypothetical protein